MVRGKKAAYVTKCGYYPHFVLTTGLFWVKEKMRISGKQVSAARELLGITQTELATMARVSEDTIVRFETAQAEPRRENLSKIQAELERRGIEFTNGTGMGVRLNYEKAAEFTRSAEQNRDNTAQ